MVWHTGRQGILGYVFCRTVGYTHSQSKRPHQADHAACHLSNIGECTTFPTLACDIFLPMTLSVQQASTDLTTTAVMQFYTDVWNQGDVTRMADIAHADFTFRGSLGTECRGLSAFEGYVRLVTTAMGNYHCDVQELVASDSRVFAKVLFSGIHQAEFLGIPPSGKRVAWYGAALFTFVQGKIADLWVLGDIDGLKRQLADRPFAAVPQQIPLSHLTVRHEVNRLGQLIPISLGEWAPPPAPEPVVLRGRFCRLEPLERERHAAALYAANYLDTDGRMWTYLPYGPFETFESYQAWLERPSGDPILYVIVTQPDNQVAGLAAYLNINPAAGSIEVGHLAYSPLLQRTTAATEAMVLMMAHAFALGYRRYEWKADVFNIASRQAAQRLGFSFEGVFRQHRTKKGRNCDTVWYSVIDSEWPALKAVFHRWLAPDNFDATGQQRVRLSDLTHPLLRSPERSGW